MGYGLHLVKNAEKERFEKTVKSVETEVEVDSHAQKENAHGASQYASSRNRFQRPPQSPESASPHGPSQRFRRTPQESTSPSDPEEKLAPSQVAPSYQSVKFAATHSSGTDNGEIFYDEASSAEAAGSSTPSDLPQKPSAFEMKCLKTRRMVQDLAEFKKWTAEDTEKAERLAMRNPDKALEMYADMYRNELQVHRATGVRTLQEGIQKNPGATVFMLHKKDKSSLKVITSDKAGSQALLHGAVLESLPRQNTPFAHVVFAPAPTKPEHEQVQVAIPSEGGYSSAPLPRGP